MTVSFVLGDEVTRLLGEVREWSLSEVRPLARAADRETSYPDGAAKVIDNCPVDICPLAFEEIGARPSNGSQWRALLEGGSNLLGCLVMEEMTYGDGWAWQVLPGSGLGEKVIQLLGTPSQIERWVGGSHRGDIAMTAIAMTEDGCGSDLASIATTAVRDGDSWVINGQKRFISNGAEADYVLVLATVDPALRTRGVKAFIVERDTPGYTVVKQAEDKLGLRFMHQSTLQFDDVHIPVDQCLSGADDRGLGTLAALQAMNSTRPFCATWAVGTARASCDYAADWLAAQRRSFTPRRWNKVEDDLAQMRHAIGDAQRLVRRAAWMHDQGLPDAKEASMAKAFAPRIAEQVCLRSLQLMGSEGYSEEHLVEKWYRDVKLFDIVEGTGQIQRITIARDLLGTDAARA